MPGEESEKQRKIAVVRIKSVWGGAALVAEPGAPSLDGAGERQLGGSSHARTDSSSARARKLRSSVPWLGWKVLSRREPKANAKALAELAQWYAKGLVKPVIDLRLPMPELLKAFEIMASRQVRGKLVMTNP